MKSIKITMLFISLLLFTANVQAQISHYNTTDTVFQFVDTRPQFPGGHAALLTFFSENIIHPAEVRDTGWQGRIVVQFVVRKTGEITDVGIFHEIFPPLDKEVKRIAKLMPNWIPGKHNGERVNVKYILPINLNVQPRIYDEAPQFPGGDEVLLQYLLDNIQYPPCDEEEFSFGRVVLQFNVLKSGEISDIEVIRGVAPKLDAEVVRVVEAMPNWIPAKRNGEKIDALFRLPVNFLAIELCRTDSDVRIPRGDLYANDFIFPITQKRPYFPGGETALMHFLRTNIQFPHNAARDGVEGRVITSFVIERDGSVVNIETVGSYLYFQNGEMLGEREPARRSLEREAQRVIRRMPNWLPGEIMGEKVNGRFSLPIVFRLQGSNLIFSIPE